MREKIKTIFQTLMAVTVILVFSGIFMSENCTQSDVDMLYAANDGS